MAVLRKDGIIVCVDNIEFNSLYATADIHAWKNRRITLIEYRTHKPSNVRILADIASGAVSCGRNKISFITKQTTDQDRIS